MELRRVAIEQKRYPASLLLIPIVLLIALVLINPVPLVGGYTDDFKYLIGAQCLDCLPTNHWERRFAIVWPTGIAIQLFGQNLWSVLAFPVLAGVVAVALTFKLVEQQYGRKAAFIATSTLVLTPVFNERSMRLGIDMIELVFLLGSIFVLQRRKSPFWAGALMAMAVLCRPTQFAALPIVALLAWYNGPRNLKWFALGFIVPLAGESLIYFILAGDPLYPWKLSLTHMQTWRASLDKVDYSHFMSPDVDTTKSPLFNPDFIGGWVPISGIETHWTVQGILNLLVNPESGVTLCAGIFLCLLAWKRLDRLQLILIGCAAFYFGVLTYGFAIDPRPRIFLPILVIASVLIGSLATMPWPWPRKVVVPVFLIVIVIVGVFEAGDRINYREAADKAEALISQRPYLVTANTRQRMALIRQDFPAGGSELIEIDDLCPILKQGRWLSSVDGDLCIYRKYLPTPASMEQVVAQAGYLTS